MNKRRTYKALFKRLEGRKLTPNEKRAIARWERRHDEFGPAFAAIRKACDGLRELLQRASEGDMEALATIHTTMMATNSGEAA